MMMTMENRVDDGRKCADSAMILARRRSYVLFRCHSRGDMCVKPIALLPRTLRLLSILGFSLLVKTNYPTPKKYDDRRYDDDNPAYNDNERNVSLRIAMRQRSRYKRDCGLNAEPEYTFECVRCVLRAATTVQWRTRCLEHIIYT